MNNFTEIIRFAIDKESEAEAFYLQVAAKMTNETTKRIFVDMAVEEKHHREMLTEVLNSKKIVLQCKHLSDYKISESLEKTGLTDTMTIADVFTIAMKNEEAAMKMYRKLAADSPSEHAKRLFENLAMMEQGHKVKLEEGYTDVAYGEVW